MLIGISIYPGYIRILCLLPEIPCCCWLMPMLFQFWLLRSKSIKVHVCRFESISMLVVVGQHPPNDCRAGILYTESLQLPLWIIAHPSYMILLVARIHSNSISYPHFVSVALNSMLVLADAYVNSIFCCESKPVQCAVMGLIPI